ncbi:GntR family transcriptional regulator [Nocardiopsis sp. FIRDI 009]|uniref:GntR family transcriptional regulator n=1 Tax=Nocardiopsis sp. FIRDI 009 TaxID=714197 RepID=UPI000E26A7BE|nr:GntR family transcriptional regulator [Nocardiopsis sp. FIRDI 009]
MGRNEPLYTRPADWVREQIRTGKLRPGENTPTERELASRFNVSRATAARALDLLVNEGLISPGNSRAGRRVRDTRVLAIHASRSESVDHRRTAGVDAWVSDTQAYGLVPGQSIRVEVVPAAPEMAAYLQVENGAPVAVRRRLRTLDGDPSNVSDSYYPMSLTQEIPEILDPADVPQGVIALMAERGFAQTNYVDRLRWRPPTPEEAQLLRIGSGVSVLTQTRIGYMDDQVVRVTEQIWPGDRIELVYELPA